MSTERDELAADIRGLGITVIDGPPVDLTEPLAQHLHNLGYRSPSRREPSMTATSIPALLEPIQARLDAATPGPWHLDRDEPGDVASVVAYAHNDGVTIGTYVADTVEEDGDAAFIANAPTDTARLLAAVKAADSILSQALTMISADPDVSEYERGFDDSTRGLSAKLRSAVEAALRSEA